MLWRQCNESFLARPPIRVPYHEVVFAGHLSKVGNKHGIVRCVSIGEAQSV